MPILLKLPPQRIALGLLLLMSASVLIFGGTQLLPGNVAETILGQWDTTEAPANLPRDLGLEESPVNRYFD